jgi:hypothetical protein
MQKNLKAPTKLQKKMGIKNEKKVNNEKAAIDCIPPAVSRGFFHAVIWLEQQHEL